MRWTTCCDAGSMKTDTAARTTAATADRQGGTGQETTLKGQGVSPGIVIGPAYVLDRGCVSVPETLVPKAAVTAEIGRLTDAVDRAARQVEKLKDKAAALPAEAAEEVSLLLDAHLAILSGSRLIRGARARIEGDRLSAPWAVQQAVGQIVQQFAAIDDPYIASRADDIREVGNRVIRNLVDVKFKAFSAVASGSVVLADEITPADTALMDPTRIAGFASAVGGAQGHTAIMARSLGLPAVLGPSGLTTVVRTGETVILDGTAGAVVVRPEPATLARYRQRRAALAVERRELALVRTLPAVTVDGTRIGLHANLELPRDVAAAMAAGAEGVGLLRTEFLYMNRSDLPDEDEQTLAFEQVVTALGGRPATIRTLDVGADKIASALKPRFADVANPALGLRAIRLQLQDLDLLRTQLAAILRAGAIGPVRILLPMIASVSEVDSARTERDRVAADLIRRGVRIADPLPPLGAMIEIPGAALIADRLARACDFLAIGTNDLVMYTLAVDRGDEQVAHLYDPWHPAVRRLIDLTVEGAAQAGIPVSVCGEIAGDPAFTEMLLAAGVRELSMSPGRLPAVKRQLRGLRTGSRKAS